ncbi:MAG: hypothetical protein GX096_02575 [Clostridiales bacterium]|nr:hypothetical protein [Clostridiales bacterium]
MAQKDERKQVPLRLSAQLYKEVSAWAQNDFRSINGQIEFLLTECVRQRKRTSKGSPAPTEDADEPTDK